MKFSRMKVCLSSDKKKSNEKLSCDLCYEGCLLLLFSRATTTTSILIPIRIFGMIKRVDMQPEILHVIRHKMTSESGNMIKMLVSVVV